MRLWLSAAFFAGYLALQLALPAAQLIRQRQAFRWGMFAYTGARYEIVSEYADGTTESLAEIQKRTGRARLFRSEIDREKALPPYLCALSPAPSRIYFHNLRTGEEKRYPCR